MTEGAHVEPVSTVEAVVNPPALVTLYHAGVPVQVPPDQIDHFLNIGFLRHSTDDLGPLVAELELLSAQMVGCARRFVTATLRSGVIDAGTDRELHALQKARGAVEERLQNLVNVTFAVYRVKQEELNADA